jgi:hypothetical protein
LLIGYFTLAAADEAFVRNSGAGNIRVRELAGGYLLARLDLYQDL